MKKNTELHKILPKQAEPADNLIGNFITYYGQWFEYFSPEEKLDLGPFKEFLGALAKFVPTQSGRFQLISNFGFALYCRNSQKIIGHLIRTKKLAVFEEFNPGKLPPGRSVIEFRTRITRDLNATGLFKKRTIAELSDGDFYKFLNKICNRYQEIFRFELNFYTRIPEAEQHKLFSELFKLLVTDGLILPDTNSEVDEYDFIASAWKNYHRRMRGINFNHLPPGIRNTIDEVLKQPKNRRSSKKYRKRRDFVKVFDTYGTLEKQLPAGIRVRSLRK